MVNQRTKHVGLTLALMAMAFFVGWPFWKWVGARPVDSTLQARTMKLVEVHPDLKAAWQIAMLDDVLTWPEAKILVESKGEKLEAVD